MKEMNYFEQNISLENVNQEVSLENVNQEVSLENVNQEVSLENVNQEEDIQAFSQEYLPEKGTFEWIESTEDDRIDCICSVVSEGTYKNFVGIITMIDIDNHSLTFASGGDFLMYVSNSDDYEIGDTILFDGTKLDEDLPITQKIQKSIVGSVVSKISKNTVAIFKY